MPQPNLRMTIFLFKVFCCSRFDLAVVCGFMMFASSTVQVSIRLDILVLKPCSIVCVIKLVVYKAVRPRPRKRANY